MPIETRTRPRTVRRLERQNRAYRRRSWIAFWVAGAALIAAAYFAGLQLAQPAEPKLIPPAQITRTTTTTTGGFP